MALKGSPKQWSLKRLSVLMSRIGVLQGSVLGLVIILFEKAFKVQILMFNYVEDLFPFHSRGLKSIPLNKNQSYFS